MSYYSPEKKSVWDTIVDILRALFNAARQGFSNLVQFYRNLLAQYGYNTNTYA